MKADKQANHVPLPVEEGVHLRDYLNLLRRRWKILLLVFLLVLGGVALKTYLTKPVYEASLTLEIQKNQKGGILKELGVDNDSSLSADIEILRSRSMAERVVQMLNLDWSVDPEQSSPGLVFQLQEISAGPTVDRLQVELTGADRFRVRDQDGRLLGETGNDQPLAAGDVRLTGAVLTGKAGQRLVLLRTSPVEVAEDLMRRIHAVEMGKGTNILSLSYEDTDPIRARDVVNALASAYQRQSVTAKTREAGKTVQFINQQIANVKSTLNRTEQDLQEYKVQSGLVTLGPEGQSLVERLVNLEEQKAELALKRKRLQFAIDEVQQALATGGPYTPTIIESVPFSADSAGKLAQLEADRKSLLADFTEAHPAVQNIQQQIHKLQEALLTAYRSGQQDLKLEEDDLKETIAGYDRQLAGIPKAEQELAKRARVNKVNAELYTFLLQKQQEAKIAEASTLSGVEIIDPAFTPKVPIKPNTKKNLALGLILGLMLGCGAAFFLEYLDDTINDAEKVQSELGLPVIGIIPRIDPQGPPGNPARMLVTQLPPKSASVEACRALRTGIHFATARSSRKVLLVTSSLPGEGKSTVSANLALVLAQTGSRVLLVGCDLRRPSLFAMFNIPKEPGLSDLMVDDVKDYLHHIPDLPLDLICSGRVPPNPAELLGSSRMKRFIEYARERYDYVVLDAPPVLPVTDSQILAELADEVLVVLEPCRIPRKAAQRTVEALRHAEANLIGVALNDKAGKGFRYYGNYAYYGHKSYGGYYGEGTGPAEPNGILARLRRFFG